MVKNFLNPYMPGAGHAPPYLAGRGGEQENFEQLLQQHHILENMVLTGLRGVGKTVLLGKFRNVAKAQNWLWVGSELSEESGAHSNENMAVRLLVDLAVISSQVVIQENLQQQIGFNRSAKVKQHRLDYRTLSQLYETTPGLVADKLKMVLRNAWHVLSNQSPEPRGLVFAYDEAQNLSDNSKKGEYPLSTLLEVFQSLQREGLPLLLVLTGLPTLFPKLVDTRTYAERMFKVVELTALDKKASKEAILKPLDNQNCPVRLTSESVDEIVSTSGGYPYFIQFICKETYDIWTADTNILVSMDSIISKLDRDFFAGRWDKATDRQRDLMRLIASLATSDKEFKVQEIVEASKAEKNIKDFSPSHVTQTLGSLIEKGLIYRNRHGKYIFAVPLMADFIRRIRQESL